MKKTLISVVVFVLVIILISFLWPRTEEKTANQGVSEELLSNNLNMSESNKPVTQAPPVAPSSVRPNGSNQVTINTNLGDITFETYDYDAPLAVENFLNLARAGFYDGLIFHRVISGFMIQGGDPKGNGTGDPGYVFADELNPATESYKTGYKKGAVAMANRGPNTNGSQFFIMLEDYDLPNRYTIFGQVIKGQEIVDKIGKLQTGANDRPIESVIMNQVIVK